VHLLLDGFIEHALWEAPDSQFDADIQCGIVLDLCRMMSNVVFDQNLSIPAVLKDATVVTENAKAFPTPPPESRFRATKRYCIQESFTEGTDESYEARAWTWCLLC
jgi:hypothetical protein